MLACVGGSVCLGVGYAADLLIDRETKVYTGVCVVVCRCVYECV